VMAVQLAGKTGSWICGMAAGWLPRAGNASTGSSGFLVHVSKA